MSSWSQSDLDALEEAIASGAQTVAYEGKTVTYRSLDDMFRIRDDVRKALGISTGVNATLLVAHRRGF